MLANLATLVRSKKGQSLVEYGILVGGVALASLVSVAMLGHKIGYLFGTSAGVLPTANAEADAPLFVGKLVKTTTVDGAKRLSSTPGTFESNLGIIGADALVTD